MGQRRISQSDPYRKRRTGDAACWARLAANDFEEALVRVVMAGGVWSAAPQASTVVASTSIVNDCTTSHNTILDASREAVGFALGDVAVL